MQTKVLHKKIYIAFGVLGLFLASVIGVRAYIGPTSTPPNGQPENFISSNGILQLKDGDPLSFGPISPDYTLRVIKNPGSNKVGVGTEGILAWTLDAIGNNANRALITYGKLVADLSGVNGTGPYARTAVKLFTNPLENNMSVVLTNKPILGFWLDGYESGSLGTPGCDSCTLTGFVDGWATGFFGQGAVSSLILGGDFQRTTSYSGGTLTDLDVAGTTNIGIGDVCVMRTYETCPLGSYLSSYMPLNQYGAPFAGNSNNTKSLNHWIADDPTYAHPATFNLDAEYSRMCTFFDPSPTPSYIGPCTPDQNLVIHDPLLNPIENLFGAFYGYNPWYMGTTNNSALPYPQEAPTSHGANYAISFLHHPDNYASSTITSGGSANQVLSGFYADFSTSLPIFKKEFFNVKYTITIPAYTFKFTPQASSVPASAVGVPVTITIPAQTYTYNTNVAKNPDASQDRYTTFLGNPMIAYIDNAKTLINNTINSYNQPPNYNYPNGTLAMNDTSLGGEQPKKRGFLGTPIAYALPNFPGSNISGALMYWFAEKMTVTKQCIYPVSPYMKVDTGINFPTSGANKC